MNEWMNQLINRVYLERLIRRYKQHSKAESTSLASSPCLLDLLYLCLYFNYPSKNKDLLSVRFQPRHLNHVVILHYQNADTWLTSILQFHSCNNQMRCLMQFYLHKAEVALMIHILKYVCSEKQFRMERM